MDTLITAPAWWRGSHHATIIAEARTRTGDYGWTIELACDPYTRWTVTEWDAYLPGDAGPVTSTPPPRSEERRVGKECRSRWSPYH